MSDMKTLLEAVTKFAYSNPKQKPGDQVRGTDKSTPRKDGRHPFAGRLVGGESQEHDEDSLEESLMREYRHYVEDAPPLVGTNNTAQANVQPGGTTTSTTANAAPAGAAVQGQPVQPVKPTQPGAQAPQAPLTAQQQAQQKQKLTTNLTQLKSIDPTLNIPGTATAVTKDPKNLTPMDAKNLDKMANTMKPAMLDQTGISQLKSLLTRMNKTPQQGQ